MANPQMLRLIVGVGALLPIASSAQVNDWPEPVAEALAAARANMDLKLRQPPRWQKNVKPGPAASDFAKAIDSLATTAPAEVWKRVDANPAGSIDDRLLVIARDRRRNPEMYERFKKDYLIPIPRRHGTPRGPGLSLTAFAEEYRLAVEYYLLSPKVPNSHFVNYKVNLLMALAWYDHPDSYRTFLHMYATTCDSSMNPVNAENLQRTLIGSLVSPGSVARLHTLLDCLLMSADQQAKLTDLMAKGREASKKPKNQRSEEEERLASMFRSHNYYRDKYGDLEAKVRRAFKSEYPAGSAERYRRIIEAYRKSQPPPEHLALLDRLTAP